MTMEPIFIIIENLGNLSGKAQLNYLQSSKCEQLKDILIYTYDPHRKYKLDGKLNKFPITEGTKEFDLTDWVDFKTTILDYLSSIPSAKDSDVAATAGFISKFNQPGQDFCRKVIAKDLRINMGIKSFQKIWKDFCVEPQVQLAKSKDDRSDFVYGLYSRKFDGKRTYIADGIPMSRTNNACYTKPIQHILDQLKNNFISINDYVLDGELLYFENGKEDFQKGISLCQSDKVTEDCKNLCYVIFDIIDKDCFFTKTPYIKFSDEYKKLLAMFACTTNYTPCYSLIPTVCPNVFIARQDTDPTKLMQLRKQNNWEGLMYRNADACYEYKRTTNLLKIKQMQDMELTLLNMEEGTGKHAGRLGAFIVKYKDSTVNVGSGFSDDLRQEYWNNKDKYIGRSVKVQYFEETVDNEGKPSLRFPVFLSFRNLDTNEEFLKL